MRRGGKVHRLCQLLGALKQKLGSTPEGAFLKPL